MKHLFQISCLVVFLAGTGTVRLIQSSARDQVPTSAPLMTDSPGQTGGVAAISVFRVVCPHKRLGGSAFLHKSGKVITAAHIVAGCEPNDVILITAKGKPVKIDKIVIDSDVDLALLTPQSPLSGNCLVISSDSKFGIGSQICMWGYPTGYTSGTPLLSVGYFAGVDSVKMPSGKIAKRWVVNAAVNLGNSGGPLVCVESGKVMGVVSSKLAPMPEYIESALAALKQNKTITVFKRIKPDGSAERLSTGQVVEEVLQYLRSQTQLVIGHTVVLGDLRGFLKANGIDP